MYQALQFPPYVPYTLPALADVPAPVAGDDGKAVTYRHAFGDFVYTSFEAAGAVATHVGLANPHSQYALEAALGTMATQAETAYALLAGRAGGQSLIGGTASGNNLTLRSSSHATKGKVVFGNAGTTVYDEVNDWIGVGIATPLRRLHVVAAATNVPGMLITGGAAAEGGAGSAEIRLSHLTDYGTISYGAATGTLIFTNFYNSAVGNIVFRTKGNGTPIDALIIRGSGLVNPFSLQIGNASTANALMNFVNTTDSLGYIEYVSTGLQFYASNVLSLRVGSTAITALKKVVLSAATTLAASLNMATGARPTSPNTGDLWTESDGWHTYFGGVEYILDMTPA